MSTHPRLAGLDAFVVCVLRQDAASGSECVDCGAEVSDCRGCGVCGHPTPRSLRVCTTHRHGTAWERGSHRVEGRAWVCEHTRQRSADSAHVLPVLPPLRCLGGCVRLARSVPAPDDSVRAPRTRVAEPAAAGVGADTPA